jgi:hypothetical protein
MHPGVANQKIAEAHNEVVGVVERLGIADEELGTLIAGSGGPNVKEVVSPTRQSVPRRTTAENRARQRIRYRRYSRASDRRRIGRAR